MIFNVTRMEKCGRVDGPPCAGAYRAPDLVDAWLVDCKDAATLVALIQRYESALIYGHDPQGRPHLELAHDCYAY